MKKNRKEIIKSIQLTWDSLHSHLPYCEYVSPREAKGCGSSKFHRKAVREYAEIIKTLAHEL